MTGERDSVEAATDLLRRQRWAVGPSVSRLRTDVRSGENFLLATPEGQLPDFLLGKVVVEWGYEVTRAESDAFHAWLAANEDALAKGCPSGVTYLGTYGVFAQSERTLGAYRTIWAFESLGSLESLAREVSVSSEFGKRLAELIGFRDESIGASRSQQIYQPAAGAVRTGQPPAQA